jgi:glycopeptide antibiotics resistance protein
VLYVKEYRFRINLCCTTSSILYLYYFVLRTALCSVAQAVYKKAVLTDCLFVSILQIISHQEILRMLKNTPSIFWFCGDIGIIVIYQYDKDYLGVCELTYSE